MLVLRGKTNVVMNPVWLLYMTDTCVTPSFLLIHISSIIRSHKAHTWPYLLSILLVKNTRSTQEKHKLPKILPFKNEGKD